MPYVVCLAGALSSYRRSRIIKVLYNALVGEWIITNADKCIAISPTEVEQFATYGVAASRVLVIPNGIDAEDFKAVNKENAFGRNLQSIEPT